MNNKLDKTDYIIKELLSKNIVSKDVLMNEKRKIAKELKIEIPTNSDLLKSYAKLRKRKIIKENLSFEKILRKRAIRTMSGIAPVAVLTKPWPCPGKCAYCPTEKDVPQSYLSNEPAVMRAIRCNYNPYIQTQFRLKALEANGHVPTKIEMIVIGGTWSYFSAKYKYWYIKEIFRAANDYYRQAPKKKILTENSSLIKLKEALHSEQKRNEKTKYQIIGLTLETRQDYINEAEVLEMRDLGCTRVELGVQTTDDEILKLNKRGHSNSETIRATKMLRDHGFKITYHLMPGLPGATPKKDFEMFQELFTNSDYQPDQIKFYPTVVTKGSLLYRWWKDGKYKPYTDEQLQGLIIKCKEFIPSYVRIIRLIRDIPGESIVAGNLITNLRQIMKDQGAKCSCIRCREIKDKQYKLSDAKLNIQRYDASGGKEFFISYTSESGKDLFAFLRLRLNNEENSTSKFMKDFAIIRELHVYGELVAVGNKKNVQHSGLGQRLMKEAEKIAKENGYKKMAIISGIGVRAYYKKFGYKLSKTYMIKNL
ncbi:MAG: tRNA uridine(34) 5-carboxymethylaminomethyl modification radical SAM/GNAT enzyme Elp3 [Patescibacteria group bacterium]|jgi:elongator complex protein 3|nr:tRNA uridine(34) 5-carboxymethylaminomethyl modification radical SAM/GNAT enzyme Elp3 [Patescibacteria group bacterium]